MHFICVGAPRQPGSDAADLRYVDSAFQTIVAHVDCPATVVGKSTVPVGTARRLVDSIPRERTASRLDLAWNPELLREGTAIEDTLKPDRLVFGVTSPTAEKALMEVYAGPLADGTPIITTDLASARHGVGRAPKYRSGGTRSHRSPTDSGGCAQRAGPQRLRRNPGGRCTDSGAEISIGSARSTATAHLACPSCLLGPCIVGVVGTPACSG